MKTTIRTGFTLIELLIVVAIIAILAAIAVPNFLEAQTRSKVSRVKADLRTTLTAVEAYMVDYNHYPCWKDGPGPYGDLNWKYSQRHVIDLTTPVAYLTQVPLDVFAPVPLWVSPISKMGHLLWYNREKEEWRNMKNKWGIMMSWGPGATGIRNQSSLSNYWALSDQFEYDPSNGTVSIGRIQRFVPGNLAWSEVSGR
jgi:prepilin-type N-terminal cleavage/methylation domain-containing protein